MNETTMTRSAEVAVLEVIGAIGTDVVTWVCQLA